MHFEIEGKDFPSTKDISTDKGVEEIKSYYPRFAHVKESSKASHIRKYLKAGFRKTILKKIFGKYFMSFENSLLGYSKSNFQRKALEANANFNVFKSQCPKIRILSKAL